MHVEEKRTFPTRRQLDAWHAMVAYQDEHGIPPTAREVGERIGVNHKTAHDHMASLVVHGWAAKIRNQYRRSVMAIRNPEKA